MNQPGTTPYDGILSNSIPTSNGIKLKTRNSNNLTTENDSKLAKIVQMQELTVRSSFTL